MGPLGNLLGMLPGLCQIKKQLNVEEMDESLLQARRGDHLLDDEGGAAPTPTSSTAAAAAASPAAAAPQPADVNRVLKQYREAKKIMQQISTGRGPKISPLLR